MVQYKLATQTWFQSYSNLKLADFTEYTHFVLLAHNVTNGQSNFQNPIFSIFCPHLPLYFDV